MAEIPREIMTEILLYLPVKSLLRFRCVSKCLCSLVDSVEFKNWHLITSSEYLINRMMIFQDRSRRFHVCNMNDVGGGPSIIIQDQVYGYCKGLLLLYGNSPQATLWNPSTHRRWTLPCFPPCACFPRIAASGLGCDSSHHYKAVFILYAQESDNVQVWVYGVRSNTWTRVEFEHKFGGFMHKPSSGYFADGCLHWLVSDNKSRQEILTFDVGKETFSFVGLPVCSAPSDGVLADVHVLDRSLCVSFYYSSLPLQAELYMRDKDGRWTQLYSINEPIILGIFRFQSIRVLGYSKSRKKILIDFGMEDLVTYDVERMSFSKDETKKSPLWNHPLLCIENLAYGATN